MLSSFVNHYIAFTYNCMKYTLCHFHLQHKTVMIKTNSLRDFESLLCDKENLTGGKFLQMRLKTDFGHRLLCSLSFNVT